MSSLRTLRRRTFFKALGLGLSVPIALRLSKLAGAAPGDRPTRLFIYYMPHGVPVEHYEPGGDGTSFDLAAKGKGILSPFEPFRQYLTVIKGVGMQTATNHAAIRAVLTGVPEGDGGDSIDFSIAQALGTTPHVIGAHPYLPSQGFNADCYLVKHGSWVRPTESPVEAADTYFESLPAGGNPGTEPAFDEAAFRTETLTLTEQEVEALQTQVAGLTSEQDKLQLHLEALRALKAGGGSTIVSCEERPALPAVDAVAGLDPLDQTNFGLMVDAHLEAAAHALVCGAARVITMQNMFVNSTLNFGFSGGPGVAKGHHDPISHSWDAAGRAEFADCQKWFYERLAEKLLSVLDQPDPADPEHTVLDNTIVYVCSEISDGANHNSDASDVWLDGQAIPTYLPQLLIGGGGGSLKTGHVVTVNRFHVDVMATIAKAMGAPLTTIGGQNVSSIPELEV